jgi:hypothetical protein
MKITAIKYYDGSQDKVSRLGLSSLFLELQQALLDTEVLLLEEKDANGAAEVRKAIDEALGARNDWVNTSTGDVDWIKRIRYNNTVIARLGVEIQISARSDLIIRDIVHLRNSLQEGNIDVAVIVVPSDRMERFLPDRSPAFRDAIRYIEDEFKEAMTFPIVVMAIEHDGPGPALKKQKRKS